MKRRIEITPQLLDVDQIHAYLGGNIGVNKIRALIKSGIIEGLQYGSKGKYMATRAKVNVFLNRIYEAPLQTEDIDVVPLSYLEKICKN